MDEDSLLAEFDRRVTQDATVQQIVVARFDNATDTADIYTDRTEALLALANVLPPDKKYKLVSTDLRVNASPGGHAAWASDVITIDGDKYSLAIVMTEADELWTIAAIQIGIPIPAKELKPKRLAPPAPVPAPADPAKPLLQLFEAGALDPGVLQEQLANRPSTVVRRKRLRPASMMMVTRIDVPWMRPRCRPPISIVPEKLSGIGTGFGRAEMKFWKITRRMALTAKLVRSSVVPLAPRTGRKAMRSISIASTIAITSAAQTASGNGRPSNSAKQSP